MPLGSLPFYFRHENYSPALRQIDRLGSHVLEQAFHAVLYAETGLLVPAKRRVRTQVEILVDPDGAGLKASGNVHRLVCIL